MDIADIKPIIFIIVAHGIMAYNKIKNRKNICNRHYRRPNYDNIQNSNDKDSLSKRNSFFDKISQKAIDIKDCGLQQFQQYGLYNPDAYRVGHHINDYENHDHHYDTQNHLNDYDLDNWFR